MMNAPYKKLVMPGICYLSKNDKESFLQWLGKIFCIAGWREEGINLVIELKEGGNGRIDDKSLREMIALFSRYNMDMPQLAKFETKKNHKWFRNPEEYWYSQVFESRKNDIHMGFIKSSYPAVLLIGNSETFSWLAKEIEGRWPVTLDSNSQNGFKRLEIIPSRHESKLLTRKSASILLLKLSVADAKHISDKLNKLASNALPGHVFLEPSSTSSNSLNYFENLKIIASKDEYDFNNKTTIAQKNNSLEE